MPKGENLLAQSKRTAPPLFKFSKTISQKREIISTGICFTKGKKLSQILDSKGRTSQGNFYLAKEKAFETGGEFSKS
jgi:tRNA U34 2-thiouridine synthase MnmA/TrmU